MGKGSDRRPALVPDKQVEDNWRRTFGRSHVAAPEHAALEDAKNTSVSRIQASLPAKDKQ